jgi:uncharacterized membrane protein
MLAVFLIVTGALGWWAAFSLTLDKIAVLKDPTPCWTATSAPWCSAARTSHRGRARCSDSRIRSSGSAGSSPPIAVGVALLAGARFAGWFWIAFNVGIAGAIAFVIWLISQSIFVLGTLCPWCMLVLARDDPAVLGGDAAERRRGRVRVGPASGGVVPSPWVVPITVFCYLVVALLAQVQLDIWRTLTA